MSPALGRRLASGLLLGSALLAGPDGLAAPSAQDRGLAEGLFVQAKKLMSAGRYEEACVKLAESQRLDPGGGTMMNLALCHQHEGKLVTAWADFKEALALARRDSRPDREAVALEHIAALEPRIPHLTVKLEAASTPGLELRLGGAELSRALWGEPMPLDPGSHRLEASAPGHAPWSKVVEVQEGARTTVTVPALIRRGAAAKPGAVEVKAGPGAADGGSAKTLGFVIGGVGLAALGVGSYFGVRTLSKKAESDDLCPTTTTCTRRGLEANDDAHTSAWLANIGVGVGLVGVGIGTYLILSAGSGENDTPPEARRGVLRLGATVGKREAAMELGGAF